MKLYYDLHIHSIASPCADDTMLPNDIAGMSYIKGLDIISVVDHVCGVNMQVSAKAAQKYDLLFLPGIEVTSNNGIHLLCYFSKIQNASRFSEMIYQNLPNHKNIPTLFGEQWIVDELDQKMESVQKSLLQKTSFDIWKIIDLCKQYHGLVVPAHINRDINGLLSIYDDIGSFGFHTIEIRSDIPISNEYLIGQKVLDNSDAHTLTDIHEKINYIEVKERSIQAVFEYLEY